MSRETPPPFDPSRRLPPDEVRKVLDALKSGDLTRAGEKIQKPEQQESPAIGDSSIINSFYEARIAIGDIAYARFVDVKDKKISIQWDNFAKYIMTFTADQRRKFFDRFFLSFPNGADVSRLFQEVYAPGRMENVDLSYLADNARRARTAKIEGRIFNLLTRKLFLPPYNIQLPQAIRFFDPLANEYQSPNVSGYTSLSFGSILDEPFQVAQIAAYKSLKAVSGGNEQWTREALDAIRSLSEQIQIAPIELDALLRNYIQHYAFSVVGRNEMEGDGTLFQDFYTLWRDFGALYYDVMYDENDEKVNVVYAPSLLVKRDLRPKTQTNQ